MSSGIELFTVPAGTIIDQDSDGRWVFHEPDALPYWITIVAGWPPEVIKTSISPDCKMSLSVGVSANERED